MKITKQFFVWLCSIAGLVSGMQPKNNNGIYYYNPTYIIDDEKDDSYDTWISFSSGYLDSQYNSYDLATFGLELINVGDYLIGKIDRTSTMKRALSGVLFSYVYYMYELAYHEMGHGLRCRANKGEFQLMTEKETGNYSRSENFWSYFFKCIGRCSASGVTVTNVPTALIDSANKVNLLIAAGGLNHETYLAERISNAVWTRKLHGKTSFIGYMLARADALMYALNESNSPGHDINNAEIAYKNLNINVSRSNFKTAYMLGLLGGTTFSMIKGIRGGFDSSDIEPMTFHNFRVPDIFPYITSHGISYKFVSGYSVSDFFKINAGFERVIHGNTKNEFSIGAFAIFGDLEVESNLYFGGSGFNIDAALSWKVAQRLKLNCRFSSYSSKSLIGERQVKEYYSDISATPPREKNRNSMITFGISYAIGRTSDSNR